METFIGILLKMLSIIMMILFIASVALLILTFRKPKKVSVLSLIITVAISLLTLVIFSALIKYDPPFWFWLLMAVIGIAIGYFWARTTKVFIKGNQVMNRNSIWYLVVWGGIFALNQLITIVTNRPPDIAMALLIISTATVWGTNGNIMRRYFQIRGGLQPQAEVQAAPAPAKPNTIRTTSAKLTAPIIKAATSKIAAKLKSSRPAAPDAGYCHKCGAPLRENASFCMQCGGKL
jgi:hypothetical protein